MNMQENQYKKQGKHRKTQETEIQKKIPKRKKKNPPNNFLPLWGENPYSYSTGWWFGTFFIFPFSWECRHPN